MTQDKPTAQRLIAPGDVVRLSFGFADQSGAGDYEIVRIMPTRVSGEREYRVRGADGHERAIGHDQIIEDGSGPMRLVEDDHHKATPEDVDAGIPRPPAVRHQENRLGRKPEVPRNRGGSLPQDTNAVLGTKSHAVRNGGLQSGA